MKKTIKIICFLLLGITAVVASYVAYVAIAYYRIDDNLNLSVNPPLSESALSEKIKTNNVYTAVSYNIGFGAYSPDFDFFMDGGTKSVAFSKDSVINNTNGATDSVLKLNPDFVLFQEADIDGTRSRHVNQYELLQKNFPHYESVFAQNYDSPFLFYPFLEPIGKNKSGIVTLSKYHISSSLRRSLPISQSFSKFLDLDRCYSVSRIPVENNSELVLFNVHLSAYGVDSSIQEAQLDMLISDMEAELSKGNYVIVGGDFNHDMIGNSGEVYKNKSSGEETWAKPFDFDRLPEDFTIASKTKTDYMAATARDSGVKYSKDTDRWILDTFIISNNVKLIEYDTVDLDFLYSDHNPVILKFSLEEK